MSAAHVPQVLPPKDADNNWIPSTDVCQPEACFGAYKAGYNLAEDCAAGDTEIGGSAEALTLAKCVAASRAEVYMARNLPPAEADIGGFTCGLDYGEMPTWPCSFDDAALYVSLLLIAPGIRQPGPHSPGYAREARSSLLDSPVLTPATLRPQDFDANTIADTASAGCQTCVTDRGDISPCIGPPECVAHQFTPSVMASPARITSTICAGLRTTLCDDLSMNVINEKKAFFSCPAPTPPSFACAFDNDDVTSWQAGSPFTGASDTCLACLNSKAEGGVPAQSTCWGPPVCAQPAFAGLVLSSPPSSDVRNMICFGVGNAGRVPAWGEDTSDCSANEQAVIDGKKAFFECPTTPPFSSLPCMFDEDVPVYVRQTRISIRVWPRACVSLCRCLCVTACA